MGVPKSKAMTQKAGPPQSLALYLDVNSFLASNLVNIQATDGREQRLGRNADGGCRVRGASLHVV